MISYRFSQYHYSTLLFINYSLNINNVSTNFNFQDIDDIFKISTIIFKISHQDIDDRFNDIDPEVNHFAGIFPNLNHSEHTDYYSIDKLNEKFVNIVNGFNIIHLSH